jgi:hypothetical protein
VQDAWPGAVGRGHVGVVRGHEAEPTEEPVAEGVRIEVDPGEGRVADPFVADRGGPRRGDRAGAAERAGAMRRQDRDIVRQGREALEAPLLVERHRRREDRPEQVRAPDRAGQQAAAAEDRDRADGRTTGGRRRDRLRDHPREVLRRVARRGHRRDHVLAELESVAVVGAAMLELIPATRRCHDLRAGRRAGLERAGEVIVVDVRLDDADDPPALRLGRGDEPPGVTLRIDEDRLAPARQQVRGVTEPAGDEELEVHPRHRSLGSAQDGSGGAPYHA